MLFHPWNRWLLGAKGGDRGPGLRPHKPRPEATCDLDREVVGWGQGPSFASFHQVPHEHLRF